MNKVEEKNKTLLHTATRKGNIEMVHTLLEKGANSDVENDDHETPLHIAAKLGFAQICKMFLRKASMGQRKVVNVA